MPSNQEKSTDENDTEADFIKLGPWGALVCVLFHRVQIGKMSKMMLPMLNQMQKLQMMGIYGT
eukprot:7930459-Karenia_brevis.AAC.1